MYKIALDAGHGLKTAGKQTPDGIKEWSLNDKVRDKIVEYLKDYNVQFIFPDNDEGYTDESLKTRRAMYLNVKVDLAVSLHHNAYKNKWNQATGVEIWVDKNCTEEDMKLAKCIYKNLPSYTGLKGRGIKKENWLIINQNKVPAVLVEGGFMDSTIDYPVITSDKGQDGYARAVAEGIIEYLGLTKKTNTSKPKASKSELTLAWQKVMNKVYNCGLELDNNFGPDCTDKADKHQLYKKKLKAFRIQNDYVRFVQERFVALGYSVAIDGSFWEEMDRVTRQFQRDHGLKVDGYIGPKTIKKLLEL